MKPLKLFLGDLVHTWEKVSVWAIPVNIGYIASYARQELDESLNISLYKRPEVMLADIRTEKPDVVALSYYVWNLNLNKLVSSAAREANPNVLIVGGGPHFTDLNSTPETATSFFSENPAVDAFVLGQGERGFAGLVARYQEQGGDVEQLRRTGVDGCIVNDLASKNTVRMGNTLPGFNNLDQIPSPYLTGLLDAFFDEPYLPLLETNRSCPYRCAFCAWGIGTQKLSQFSLERVYAEIDYISAHSKNYGTMMICDANFGILERDVGIARHIYGNHKAHGFPTFVNVYWNKSHPDRIYRVAKEFHGIAGVGSSRQSMHQPTLKAIGRKNLPLKDIMSILNTLKIPLYTELIVGLPQETKASHLEGNRVLMDEGFEINNYNLHLLPGTRMDSGDFREKFVVRTGYRLHDNAWGVYEGYTVLEGQEVVLATPTMTVEELRSFRFVHFLFQFMWGKQWYRVFLMFWKQLGVHPVDFMMAAAEMFAEDTGDMGGIHNQFVCDHGLENFDNYEELCRYWSQDSHFERLRRGDYGKLNMQYTFEVLLNHRDAFHHFLYTLSEQLLNRIDHKGDRIDLLKTCKDVLRYQAELRFEIDDDLQVVASKTVATEYDVLAWVEQGFNGLPVITSDGKENIYEFFMTDTQLDFLKKRLEQFQTTNLNMALRKLSEYLDTRYLQFRVRRLGGESALPEKKRLVMR